MVDKVTYGSWSCARMRAMRGSAGTRSGAQGGKKEGEGGGPRSENSRGGQIEMAGLRPLIDRYSPWKLSIFQEKNFSRGGGEVIESRRFDGDGDLLSDLAADLIGQFRPLLVGGVWSCLTWDC